VVFDNSTVTSFIPPEWPGYWTSSQLGCWRCMYLVSQGIEGDFVVDSPVFEEGRLHEDDILAKLAVKGIRVYDRQVELSHPVLPFKGHPDAWADMDTESQCITRIVDVKSMDRSYWYKAVTDFILNFRHLYLQVQSYSLMSRQEPIYIPVKNRATGQIHELYFEPDPVAFAEIEAGVALLGAAVEDKLFDYLTLTCPPEDSIKAKWCPYRKRGLCEHQTNIPDVTESEVVQAISSYDEGRVLTRQGDKLKAEARKIIVTYLKGHGLKKIKVMGKTPSLIDMSRRNCDFERLLELDKAIYDEVVSETNYEKFDV